MRPRVRRARRDRRAEQHDDRRVAQREPEAYQSCRPPRLRAIDTSDARSLPVDSRVDAVDAKPVLRWDMFHAESAPRRACGPRCRWRRCGRSRRRVSTRSRARAARAPRAPGMRRRARGAARARHRASAQRRAMQLARRRGSAPRPAARTACRPARRSPTSASLHPFFSQVAAACSARLRCIAAGAADATHRLAIDQPR